MFWRLSTLSIALIGMFSSSLAIAGQNATYQDAGRQNYSPVVAANDNTPNPQAGKSDKELIAKQRTCPVTDQPLGSMGKPAKVVIKGRRVFLCCAGCKKKFMANRDEYLKKLDQQQKQDEKK